MKNVGKFRCGFGTDLEIKTELGKRQDRLQEEGKGAEEVEEEEGEAGPRGRTRETVLMTAPPSKAAPPLRRLPRLLIP